MAINDNRMLHTSIRVQELYEGRTGHAHLIVFQGLAPNDARSLKDLTRGNSGKLIIDADAAESFIRHFPGIVRLEVWHKIDAPQWLRKLFCEINEVSEYNALSPANFGM